MYTTILIVESRITDGSRLSGACCTDRISADSPQCAAERQFAFHSDNEFDLCLVTDGMYTRAFRRELTPRVVEV